MDPAHRLDSVRMLCTLVGPIPLHAREPQRQPGRVAGACLHAVEGYLDDKLRAHVNGMRVPADLQFKQPSGLPIERLIFETFEG